MVQDTLATAPAIAFASVAKGLSSGFFLQPHSETRLIMYVPIASGALAFTLSPACATPAKSTAQQTGSEPATEPQNQPPKIPLENFSDGSIRHMLFGTLEAVQQTVRNLHSRGYAEPNDWSPAISTGRFNEVMRILVKRLPTD